LKSCLAGFVLVENGCAVLVNERRYCLWEWSVLPWLLASSDWSLLPRCLESPGIAVAISVVNGATARDEIVCWRYRFFHGSLRRVRGCYRSSSSREKVADVLISRSANVG
jgi:hypothetical protein